MVLAAFTAVGGIIAVLIPTIAAVPVAIIGTFALTYLAATGAVANVFRVGGVTGSVVGLEVNSGAVLIVAAFLVALSALLVLIVMALFTSVVGRSHVAVLSLSLIISLLAYVSLEFVGDERFRVSASAPRYICAGTGPEVCMLEGTTRQLAPLAKEMQRQADVLQAIGVKLPATYAQEHPRLRANKGQGVMYMTVDAVNVGKVDPATVSDYLSTPAACDEYYGDFPPKDALAARALVADLVRDRVGIAEFPAPTGSAENAWANSVFANEWLVATFHSLRECTLDAIKPPL
ncbi:hypothetical protein ACFYL6_20600 [Micromonospora sp. NPDC007208]|uniref:hypothetical protein n=1 Tax=Micromonospora sp. NPDC007208 TaxID=3364236 RepID=UPI0036900D48